MIIEGFDVNCQRIGMIDWIISVVNPDQTKFVARVQVNGNLTPEIAYSQIFNNKENFKKHFVIDV
jgi:hypothetical protein